MVHLFYKSKEHGIQSMPYSYQIISEMLHVPEIPIMEQCYFLKLIIRCK